MGATLLARSPENAATDVAPTPVIVATVSVTENFLLNFKIELDDVVVVAAGKTNTDYTLTYAAQSKLVTAALRPRRRYPYGKVVSMRISGMASMDGEKGSYFSYESTFHVAPQALTFQDPDVRTTRVDTPFEQFPATDTLRRLLAGSMRPVGGGYQVGLFYRVQTSQLRAMLDLFDMDGSKRRELETFPARTIAPVLEADGVLQTLEVMWEAVLGELMTMGVDKSDIKLLFDAMKSSYPQERVAAAAVAILFVANYLD